MKFIAECGLNHNGNLDLTYELIRQASWAGSDVVKFQLGWRGKEGEMNHMGADRITSIIDFCHYMNVEPLFSIFNKDAYNLIKNFNMDLIKIASRTIVDEKSLVDEMISDNKKLIISLGMWNETSLPYDIPDQIDYLWCLSKYPCLPKDLLGLPDNFTNSVYTGYSDHTIGIETPLIAISRGAEIIEKHFTLDKSDTTIRDHALSATPDEFSNLVKIGREIKKQIDLGV
jgi:N,N'-diacetyllegionaminate synthase